MGGRKTSPHLNLVHYHQKELGQYDFWINFGSKLEIFGKIASFVVLTLQDSKDFLILGQILKIYEIRSKVTRDIFFSK